MLIEQWPIDKPTPYAKNARKLSPHAVDKVAASLKEFGWQQPLVVDAEGVLIVGHTRLLAAKKLGYKTVPVLVAHWLTPAQVKAYRLMDNRSHDETSWDFDLLGPEFEELKALDFDLTLTGFDRFMWDLTESVPAEWRGPEFNQGDITPFASIHVHFKTEEDRIAFMGLLDEPPGRKQAIWYPRVESLKQSIRSSVPAAVGLNKYPIYVISKGRWDSRITVRELDRLMLPYRLVVEPQEFDKYAEFISPSKILQLPFSDLGQGSIPARNWVWEHAISEGHERHWILDDNIQGFYRLNNNLKVKVLDENPLLPAEGLADQYENVALAGLNYEFFAPRRENHPPFIQNTRIYSCILIQNSIKERWRGRYNEDTDLSLRVLKAGYCTVLLNAFLCKKVQTMKMKGGNTDELYKGDGRLKMAESLRDQHPDVVTITRKWNRWQHQVDYRPFKNNKFIPKPGYEVPTETNNYGMELEYLNAAQG